MMVEVCVLDFESEWVDDSVELEVCYGICVLVLCDMCDGCELDWLFDVLVV